MRRRNLGSLNGNIFGTPMAGLGALGGTQWSVTNPVPQVPAACWDKPNFKACQSWSISSPHADCQTLANNAGNWSEDDIKNCIEDKYRYRMNTYCIGSCASGTVTYPGMVASTTPQASTTLTTLQLQQALNVVLKSGGYVLLAEDSKLGPKTCGAARQFMPEAVPSECATKGFTAPVKVGASSGGGGGGGGGGGIIVAATTTQNPNLLTTTNAGMLTNVKWLIGSSVAVALGMVGVAIAKKKKMIKGHGGR